MRLILTLFALLFTQLFFNLAHAAPQARVAAEQRKSHANEARPDDRRKKKADKAAKKAKVTAPEKKTKTAKTKSEKSAKKIVSAKPKAKAQK
ncbi:hydrolase, partial [Serratia marcescens]